jgi:hypothetical protein
VSENQGNGLITAKYLVADDAVSQNPHEEGGGTFPEETRRRPRFLAATTLFSIVFSLAVGVGICYQTYLPGLLKKASSLWDNVARPVAGVRAKRSPQTAFEKLLVKNHDDIMAEIQQRNKKNPANSHIEKLSREGWSQQDWNIGNGGFKPAPFGS